MNVKRCLLMVLCAGSLLSAVAPALADDIDEKQADMQSKINQAAASKRLSSKDAGELRRELSKFDQKKREQRASHGDVLHLSDDKVLNTMLSDINQHYEEKLKKDDGEKPAATK